MFFEFLFFIHHFIFHFYCHTILLDHLLNLHIRFNIIKDHNYHFLFQFHCSLSEFVPFHRFVHILFVFLFIYLCLITRIPHFQLLHLIMRFLSNTIKNFHFFLFEVFFDFILYFLSLDHLRHFVTNYKDCKSIPLYLCY